ncbi:MAG: (2Fe-2S)-binding protein [Porticoccaceae bacterium]|nr:(2Fe-2S)-binding protein [Porticoccaceae bacterium]
MGGKRLAKRQGAYNRILRKGQGRFAGAMAFIPLEQCKNLYEGYRRRFKAGGVHILLVHAAGVTYAIDCRCPHAGASLHKGRLDQGGIVCPKHGICFDLETGRPRGGDIVEGVSSLKFYPLIIQKGTIGISS